MDHRHRVTVRMAGAVTAVLIAASVVGCSSNDTTTTSPSGSAGSADTASVDQEIVGTWNALDAQETFCRVAREIGPGADQPPDSTAPADDTCSEIRWPSVAELQVRDDGTVTASSLDDGPECTGRMDPDAGELDFADPDCVDNGDDVSGDALLGTPGYVAIDGCMTVTHEGTVLLFEQRLGGCESSAEDKFEAVGDAINSAD